MEEEKKVTDLKNKVEETKLTGEILKEKLGRT
jgi:hypothetical protein